MTGKGGLLGAEVGKKPERKRCFVVGPIGAEESLTRTHSDWLLQGIIKPVFDQHFPDYDVIRADKISVPGMIDAQVINLLIDAELVIADMSELNPNAFYEMGIRHMEQKPIVHMFLKGEEIPFDVKPYRAIEFSREHPQHLEVAKELLKTTVESVMADGFQVDNPVTKARGIMRWREQATPGERLLLDRIQGIELRLSYMENRNTDAAPRFPRLGHLIGTTLEVKVTPKDPSQGGEWSRMRDLVRGYLKRNYPAANVRLSSKKELVVIVPPQLSAEEIATALSRDLPVVAQVDTPY